ncbi:hypothetical protein O0882_23720 [Janthinobacterium sp. SUN073]|uniref:hypothetical protein n=1 Tax=Janthinobacterium sp. SUN073 TaxID=3004102 RepID=UPI0025AFE32F|nr:hypothetical protein [Janthinobacterium sp. SUN073]MDN2699330.1 hypothetical protein [Janthinobacterium sp. SUN073]
MKNDAIKNDFENLVENGIDFLEKAIAQLEDETKHSVINFYTGVEIFLKAPLVLDHWSLVVAGGERDREKYESGDFVSVSFEDSCKLLSKSLKNKNGLTKEAKEAFNKVRIHRNRMVHFFHKASTKKEKEAIRLEQAVAWFELNKFITKDFSEEFKPFLSRFRKMESHLLLTQHYAVAKFSSPDIKNLIDGKTKGGCAFLNCPKCHQKSFEEIFDKSVPDFKQYYCHVCLERDEFFEVQCPECNDPDQVLKVDTTFECSKCDHEISTDDFYSLLDQSKTDYNNYYDANTPANCDECQGYQTICEYKGKFFCVNCFTLFSSLSQCECCGERCTRNWESSYVTGCEHCDGRMPRDD